MEPPSSSNAPTTGEGRVGCRPNPIGLSLVRLLGRDGNVLRIAGVDILDGTPLLDIKPYIPHLISQDTVRIGWLTGRTEGFASVCAPAAPGGETSGTERPNPAATAAAAAAKKEIGSA